MRKQKNNQRKIRSSKCFATDGKSWNFGTAKMASTFTPRALIISETLDFSSKNRLGAKDDLLGLGKRARIN
jgi:hypothetical protein